MQIIDDIIDDSDYILPRNKKMAVRADYVIQGGYYFETLDEAVREASRRAAKNSEDLKVYKAVKLVSPKAPEVDVKDIVLA